MKAFLKRLLKGAGLHVFSSASLPPGVDWLADVKSLGMSAGPMVFDVGANVGDTVLAIRRAIPAARVFAFEPFPQTVEMLRQRVAHLEDVRIFPTALGSHLGEVRVTARASSLVNTLVDARDSEGAVAIQVETLEEVCAREGVEAIDILKTDTEGYDLEVLKGGAKLLEAGRVRYVYCEVSFCPELRQVSPFAPIFDYLSAKGFHFLGLYETFSLHHFPAPNFYCCALFVHRSHYRSSHPDARVIDSGNTGNGDDA